MDLLDRSSSSSSEVVQDTREKYREELGAVQPDLIQAFRSASDKNSVDEF